MHDGDCQRKPNGRQRIRDVINRIRCLAHRCNPLFLYDYRIGRLARRVNTNGHSAHAEAASVCFDIGSALPTLGHWGSDQIISVGGNNFTPNLVAIVKDIVAFKTGNVNNTVDVRSFPTTAADPDPRLIWKRGINQYVFLSPDSSMGPIEGKVLLDTEGDANLQVPVRDPGN